MQFSWWTFALQVINFLILVWLLQRFLYRPVRKVLDQRRALVDSRLEEAEKSKQAAEEEKKRLENDRAQFEAEREKRLADLHKELAAEKDKILAEARAEADKIVDQGRQRIESEREEAFEKLKADIAGLAADMAARTLAARPNEALPALQRFNDYVSGLSDEDKRKLRRGANGNDALVQVVTAEPLDAAAQDKWKEQVSNLIGANADIAFDVDKTLLGGVEVCFPQAAVKLSLADGLVKLKEGMLSK